MLFATDGEFPDDAPVDEQTRQRLENISAIRQSEWGSMVDILKTTVFLDGFDEFTRNTASYWKKNRLPQAPSR